MQVQRHAIGAVLAVVVVIVIIAVAAGAYYALSASGSSNSNSSTAGSNTSTNASSSSQVVSSTTQASGSPTQETSSTSAAQSSTSSATSQSETTQSSSSTQQSSTTQASSTSGQSTFTCTSTTSFTTGTSGGTTTDNTPQYIALISQFSAMKFQISGTINGTQESDTIGYQVTSSSGGIYKGNFSEMSGSQNSSLSISFAVDANNNTVLSVGTSGFNFYGAEAKAEFDGIMGVFGLQEYYTSELNVFTDSTYFHSTGTAPMTYGTTTFDVTTYEANSLPLSLTLCGVNSQVTAYTLEVGTPPGTSLQFITFIHFAGNSNGTNEDVTFQLVSMTIG